jgi:filamentous hemagglutinin
MIALSASQVALLTSDIVWLVEQTVTLPDGSTQKALVPQLYVRTQPGDLDGSGSLLSGKDVNINLSGDLTNTGQIAGRNVVNLAANKLNNLGGRIQADDMQLSALQDLNNVGGSIAAVNSLSATAGRDLNVTSTVQQGGSTDGSVGLQKIERVASLQVSGANGQLSLTAGKDINLTAASVVNAGTGLTSLKAGNAVNLNTLTESERLDVVMEADKQYAKASQSKEVGSTVQGGGNLSVSGKDINARAATLDATPTPTAHLKWPKPTQPTKPAVFKWL